MTPNSLSKLDLISDLISSRNEYKMTEIQILTTLNEIRSLQAKQDYENKVSQAARLTINRGIEAQQYEIDSITSKRRQAYETVVNHCAGLCNNPAHEGANIQTLERILYNYVSKPGISTNLEIDQKIQSLAETNLKLNSDLIELKKPLELYIKSIKARFTAREINILDEIIAECRKDPTAYERFSIDPEELSFERIPPSFK